MFNSILESYSKHESVKKIKKYFIFIFNYESLIFIENKRAFDVHFSFDVLYLSFYTI